MTTVAGTRQWQLVNTLSTARFSVRNFGFKTVHGQIPIRSATVETDLNDQPLAVHARLHLEGLSTGNRRRDADLRQPRLLNSSKFPELCFESTSVSGSPDGWSISGGLDACGRTAALELVAEPAVHARGGEVHVRATATLDRRDVGVRAPRIMIGRQVHIVIEAVFTAV